MSGEPRAEVTKRNVQAFYDLMFTQCKPAEAIDRYAGATYIQHNPHVGDGKQAFIDYFERMAAEYPGKRVDFVRCSERCPTHATRLHGAAAIPPQGPRCCSRSG